jgi:hypothetical protein
VIAWVLKYFKVPIMKVALPQFVVSGGPAYARFSQPVRDTICFSSELSWSFCSAVNPNGVCPEHMHHISQFFLRTQRYLATQELVRVCGDLIWSERIYERVKTVSTRISIRRDAMNEVALVLWSNANIVSPNVGTDDVCGAD